MKVSPWGLAWGAMSVSTKFNYGSVFQGEVLRKTKNRWKAPFVPVLIAKKGGFAVLNVRT